MPSIFSKIIAGDIPSEIVYKDDLVTAFKDINPQAPVHILIVTNREIATAADVEPEDEQALGRLFIAARRIAEQLGISESGYRLIINCKDDGGQEVYHLHMHLVGGQRLGPMLARRD
jgi:histidine triad (HIT) family protein